MSVISPMPAASDGLPRAGEGRAIFRGMALVALLGLAACPVLAASSLLECNRMQCARACRDGAQSELQACLQSCKTASVQCHRTKREHDQDMRRQRIAQKNADGLAARIPPRFAPRYDDMLDNRPLEQQRSAALEGSSADELKLGAKGQERSWPVLLCRYAGAGSHQVRLWADTRPLISGLPPDLPAPNARGLLEQAKQQQMLDVAVDACPQTWGEVVELALGPKVWQQAAAKIRAAEQAAAAETSRAQAMAQASTNYDELLQAGLAECAAKAAAARPSCNAEVAVAVFEKLRGPAGLEYHAAIKERVWPHVGPVLEQALSTAPKAPGAGASAAQWRAFDHWDRQHGQRAATLLLRLYAVAQAAVHPDDPDTRSAADYVLPLSQGWNNLLDIYLAAARAGVLLEPGWAAATQAEMLRQSPRRAATPAAAARSPQVQWRTSRVVYLTPGAYVAHEIGAAAGQAAGDILRARQLLEAGISSIEDSVDAGRKAYWTCYERRCKDGGESGRALADALLARDRYVIATELGRLQVSNLYGEKGGKGMLALFGMRALRTGVAHSCGELLDRSLNAGRKALGSGRLGVDLDALVDGALASEAYGTYATCRDSLEFISRPMADVR